MRKLLITGGSGYLGQFVVARLRERFEVRAGPRPDLKSPSCSWGVQVHYTYSTRKLQAAGDGVTGHQVDLATGSGLDEVFACGPFDAIINCAAISQPGLCQQNPDLARAVNVPTSLLARLQQQRDSSGVEALLIHISTDQVYDGSKAWWCEGDACHPVNAYGLTKLQAETAIQEQWPRHVILRSSIIYGPPAPDPVPRPLFLQFVEKALKEGSPTTFFNDEFRSPIYVEDIVRIIAHLLDLAELPPSTLYNMGGPERLSRLDMAEKAADARGYDKAAIIPAPSASVHRPVASPADISMSIERLVKELGLVMTRFSDALGHIAVK